MDNGRYIIGLTALDDVIVQAKAEKPKGHSYIYTGMLHNRVPSVPLDVGPMYFSLLTKSDFEAAFRKMQKGRIRRNLMSLVPIVEYFRGFCRKDGHSVIFVPTHSTLWRTAFGSPDRHGDVIPVAPAIVQRAIRLAVKLGLLAVYEEGCFRRSQERMGHCAKYLYSKQAEKWIMAKMREYGVEKADFKRVTRDATKRRARREMADKKIYDAVEIGKGLNIYASDLAVYKILLQKYPMLREIRADIREINRIYAKERKERKGRVILPPGIHPGHICSAIHITRGRKGQVTAISYRPYSAAAIMTREDRHEVLERMAKDKVDEFDVPSSIYRVGRLCNFGTWEDHGIDLYQSMAGWKMDRKERAAYKGGLAQRLYFARSERECFSHVLRLGRDVEDICSRVDGWNVVREAARRMREVVGASYGSEIFLHEACIYVKALRKLLEKGKKVLLVYDCFYFIDSTLRGRGVEDVVRGCAMDYYNKWFKGR